MKFVCIIKHCPSLQNKRLNSIEEITEGEGLFDLMCCSCPSFSGDAGLGIRGVVPAHGHRGPLYDHGRN